MNPPRNCFVFFGRQECHSTAWNEEEEEEEKELNLKISIYSYWILKKSIWLMIFAFLKIRSFFIWWEEEDRRYSAPNEMILRGSFLFSFSSRSMCCVVVVVLFALVVDESVSLWERPFRPSFRCNFHNNNNNNVYVNIS